MAAVEKEVPLYICDTDRNTECPKTACHLNGGPCKHTKNQKYMRLGTMPLKCKTIVYEEDKKDV